MTNRPKNKIQSQNISRTQSTFMILEETSFLDMKALPIKEK